MSNEETTPLSPFFKSQGGDNDVISQEEKEKLVTEFKGQTDAYLASEGERMKNDLRTGKQPKQQTRTEQIMETPKDQPIPRLRPGAPTSDKVELPTTLPRHGQRALYSEGERILERASQITQLPPESPFTHTVAQRLAKGDPFSSEALESAQEETMKLVKAGLIPDPSYEGFLGGVRKAYDYVGPMAVETLIPIGVGIATTPLLATPPTAVAWFGIQGGLGYGMNQLAQSMQIGSGLRKERSQEEAYATGLISMVPGLRDVKNLSKAAKVIRRAGEGAVMAGAQNATEQGLKILTGNQEGFKGGEFAFAVGAGTTFGAFLGNMENALVKYNPKEQAAPLLRHALKQGLKEAKKEAKKLKQQGKLNPKLNTRIEKFEKDLNALKAPEDRILQDAIDKLDAHEQKQTEAFELFAKEWSESDASKVLSKSDVGETAAVKVEGDAPKAPEAPAKQQPEPDPAQGREALDTFMGGGGEPELTVNKKGKVVEDAKAELKARLITSDGEKQRLVRSVENAIRDDLKKVKGGRQGKLQYLAKVQQEIDKRLGTEAGNEFEIVLSKLDVTDDAKLGKAIEDIVIHHGANNVIFANRLDDLHKMLQEADLDDANVVSDASVAVFNLIQPMLAQKRLASASGRLLQSRQFTKDALAVKLERIDEELGRQTVSDLKEAKDLSPEELDQQIASFGDRQAIKKLLQAIQQAEGGTDVSEIRDILVKQQEAFQNRSSVKKFMDSKISDSKNPIISTVGKVFDVGVDVSYSSMLSAPTTQMKVWIGNSVMRRYNALMGRVGAKYLAIAPWARRGMSKEDFEDAHTFWAKTAGSFGKFAAQGWEGSTRAFKSGEAELSQYFERLGASALSMERTGLNGAFGQSLENLGQFIDMPGKAMAFADARTRIQLAHAMTEAKAEFDWNRARRNGEDVPEKFDDYYQGFVKQVFGDEGQDGLKIMTEQQVRRRAVIAAEKEGVAPQNMANYIENFVKNNWSKNTSEFVKYVERNTKEVTFTEEIGEFVKGNKLEEGLVKPLENILRTSPIIQVLVNPFMRTGRNIMRETFSQSAIIADTPGLKSWIGQAYAKTNADLNSGDPIRASRAKGRQIIGMSAVATLYGMAEAGFYVGNTESNWRKKEIKRVATNLTDYEMRVPVPEGLQEEVGGKTVGIDLSAIEPFVSIANIVADAHTLAQSSRDGDITEGLAVLMGVTSILTDNIANKSYYKSLGEFIKWCTTTYELSQEGAERANLDRWRKLKSSANAAVPSLMNMASMSTDNVRRRGDNLFQLWGKRIQGIAQTVPPYRDTFGDPIETHPDVGAFPGAVNKGHQVGQGFLPFRVGISRMDLDDYVTVDEFGDRRINVDSVDLKDAVAVRNAAHAVIVETGGEFHFNGGHTIKDGVDLQDIVHPETRKDAFHRWQEIYSTIKDPKGMNVKQAVVQEMKKSKMKAISNIPKGLSSEVRDEIDDPRRSNIQKLISNFQKNAYKQVLREYPILVEQRKYIGKPKNQGQSPIGLMREYNQGNTQALREGGQPIDAYKKTQPQTPLQELMMDTPYAPLLKLTTNNK